MHSCLLDVSDSHQGLSKDHDSWTHRTLLSEVYDITADRKWMGGSCKQAEMF